MRAVRAVAAVAVLAWSSACSPAVSAPDGDSALAPLRTAWTAEDPATGARILVEAVTPAPATAPAAVAEQDLLQRVALLGANQAWYRVHEIGPAALLAPGRVRSASGELWTTPSPFAATAPRERLLYLAVVRGTDLPAVGARPRRTRLVAGAATPSASDLRWDSGELILDLRERRWTSRERAEFLGDFAPHAASESLTAALPEPLLEHE